MKSKRLAVDVASSSSAWCRVSMGASVGEWTDAGVPPGTLVTIVRCQPIMGLLVTSGVMTMVRRTLSSITRALGTSAGRWRDAGNRIVITSPRSRGRRWGCAGRHTAAHWCSVTSHSVINTGGEVTGYWGYGILEDKLRNTQSETFVWNKRI